MDAIRNYYDTNAAREWERLERHRMEYALTQRTLQTYLPISPARILDIGGGPGRYAIELARQGHHVTLLDMAAGNLSLARERAASAGVEIADYWQGNAMQLDRAEDSRFDAVLLLGPLYHLQEAHERDAALNEANRVLRPGGILFAAIITRYAPILDSARRNPSALLENADAIAELLATGRFDGSPRFTHAYGMAVAEFAPLMAAHGFQQHLLLSCEGITGMAEEQVDTLAGANWDAWVDLNYQLGQDPSVFGTAFHLLYVGSRH
jgi:ubiquinone/menaquinone biosynthesis C-methylase UbiE